MSEPGKPPDFKNLTENLSQQQAKISALKELVRQSESQQGKNAASTQEKVKNIAQRLSNLKSKAAKSKHHRSSSEISDEYGISNIEEEGPQSLDYSVNSSPLPIVQRARSETPGSEKITLLRKQMELNRMKMAERESRSKEIEQMVTQLKSKFETSQMSLEKSVELGRSMGDLTTLPAVTLPFNTQQHRSVSDVSSHTSHTFNLETERNKFLEKRIRELEETISDNKTKLPESEKVRKLENKILDLEENLREKESIIEARTKAVSLLSENLTKKKKDVVDSLEETKQEMFKMQETFLETEDSYKHEVERLNRVIQDSSDEIQNLTEKCEILEKSRYDLTIENSELKTKLEDVQDYCTKISELNKLNETLQKQISNLESQRYEFITEDEVGEAKSSGKVGEEVKETNNELLERIKSLEELLERRDNEIESLQENLDEKSIELNVVNANIKVLQEKYNSLEPKPLFPSESSSADEELKTEIAKLKQQLDDANKNMIKSKLKIKQLQKQVDSFTKGVDSNSEVVRLTEEVKTLTQRIVELEEAKESQSSQWGENWGDDATETELEKKVKVLETTCQNQTSAIQLLEEQKMDMTEDLENVKQKLEDATTMKNDSELEGKVVELVRMNEELGEKIQQMNDERATLEVKLSRYICENMELHERIEKLSKGSSAESIEMVNLTAQDNEEYQKAISGAEKDVVDESDPQISRELNESLRNLREESSELMSKIELFTIERREVLDKLDAMTIENQVLVSSIESIRDEKVALEHENEKLIKNRDGIEKLLSELQTEKEELLMKVSELNEHRSTLQEEINKLVKEDLGSSSPTIKTGTSTDTQSAIDKDACEKLLKQLDNEIQNLNKNKDKHQKLKISKKLSDNAKNVHAMMTNLLVDYYKNLDVCKQLREDLESVKVSLSSVSLESNNEEELKILQSQLRELEEKLATKVEECDQLKIKLKTIEDDRQSNVSNEIEILKMELEESIKSKDNLVDELKEMIDKLTNERDEYKSELQKQMNLVQGLREEYDQLTIDVKENKQKLNEKSTEFDHIQREFDMRLKTSTNEVEILKTLVGEQKQLLIDSYQEHELDINQKLKEINDYQNQVKQMEDELNTLRQQTQIAASSESLQDEIVKLKNLLEENNKLLDDHKDDLMHKQETIDTLNNQIIDLYKTMEENANKIIEKDDELQYLQEINDSNKDEIRNLHQKVSESNKAMNELRSQLTEKSHESERLVAAAKVTIDPKMEQKVKKLENEVTSLETKNKEQHEKLKKFAANLKKKQSQCLELEERLAKGVDDTSTVSEMKAQIIQYEEQLNAVKIETNNLQQSAVKASNDELNELRQKLNEKSMEVDNLQRQLQDTFNKCDQLEEALFDRQSQIQKLETEQMKFDVASKALNEIQSEFNHVKRENEELKVKLSEYSSSQDKSDDDKKKMDKLKAAVVQLKHKLAERKKEIDELTKLNSAASNVDSLQSQLDEIQQKHSEEINMLRQQIADLDATNRLLNEDKQRKVSLEGQLETFEMTNVQLRERISSLEESLNAIESEKNSILREQLSLGKELEEKNLQVEMKRMQSLHEKALAAKHAEIDDMEAELSSQLQKIENEKKIIQESLEKANDQIVDFQDEVVRLKDNIHSLEQSKSDAERELSWLKLQNENYTQDQLENEQLRMQLMQSETEAENLRSQNETLSDNHNVEITILRQQIADLEAMRSQVSQNQTDDQVMLQNENVKLKEILVEKENEIQQKKIQLQMVSTFVDAPIQAVNDPFANLMAAPPQPLPAQSSKVDENAFKVLEDKLREAEKEIEKLNETAMLTNMEIDMQANKVEDLIHENKVLLGKLHEMEAKNENLISLKADVNQKNEIIQNLQEKLMNFDAKPSAVSEQPTTQTATTSILFGSEPSSQPSAASLFDDVPFIISTTNEPQQEVFEEIIQPKKAYLCYDNKPPASLLSPRSDLEVRLKEQEDIVERLTHEKADVDAKLTTAKENSKKMMKKLKEYQVKISELETKAFRKSSSVESNDMDLVIQEELNSQIQRLEAKLKEVNTEKEKEHQEKEALIKRIDVLTLANERMTEMKERQDGQMELYQLKIRDLTQKLQKLEEWSGEKKESEPKIQAVVSSLPLESSASSPSSNVELNKKIQELNDQLKDLQVDFDEIQALLDEEKSTNKQLEEKITKLNSMSQDEISKDQEENEKLKRNCEALRQQINTKDQEIRDLISKIDLLSNESSNIKTILDDLSVQNQLKTNENQELLERLQNLAANNEELSRERQLYSDSMEQNYRQHSQDLEQQLQSIHAELHYKNSQLQELKERNSEFTKKVEVDANLIIEKNNEIVSLKNLLQELEAKVEKQQPSQEQPIERHDDNMKKEIEALKRENAQMEHELQVLNDQVLSSLEFEDKMKNVVYELDAKNLEIQMLKSSLEKVEKHQQTSSEVDEEVQEKIQKLQNEKEEVERNMKLSIDLLNAQWSQAVEQRGNEVANSWKQHLEMREMEFSELEASLRSQLGRNSDEVTTSESVQKVSDIDDDAMTKMRSIMESQEMEIVSLKEQLAIRSAEYAALSAKVDPYHQMSTSMNISPIPPTDSERVPRSELDLALYMLHQRDMRLEEMTMELVRLLEERDQLQIRLSNSIRQMEEVKTKFSASHEAESSDASKTTTPEKLPTNMNVTTFEDDGQLKKKLSELNTVRHVRDKDIQDERERRFMDNITMLQRDVANIPPEAAARIVAGSSDQGQSPSSVLMNWILGKQPESS
ncbi:CLUMA_CG017859, isoform B [Clunio marinus]|uniref:CLUMA_CG017859, isoform B n=1 Tax=Clunio marinus TaxID=568069 RepID=A0A1J1J066_9DIPT|nr:CLUMA_CG017859, isoform B [Clunio marinus]